MPRKPTPAGKKRVRTGCLTCRKRRRKCDEHKPRCANCELKGFTCKYGSDLAFVPLRPGEAGVGTRQVYGTITFVDNSPAARAAAKEQSRQSSKNSSGVRASNLANSEISHPGHTSVHYDPPETRTPSGLNDILTTDVPLESPQRPSTGQSSSIRVDQAPRSFNSGANLSLGDSISPQTSLSSSNRETDLLRHFRYHISPWIDVGDPDCALGIQVLLRARSNRPLQAAILALAACQRPLIPVPSHIEDIDSGLRFRREAEDSLSVQSDLIGHAGRALLLLQDLLPVGLEHWRDLLVPQIERLGGLPHPATMEDDLGEGVFWLLFRLDLATSIHSAKQPIMPFRSYINRDGSPIQTPLLTVQPRSINQVYKHALSLLALCLSLIHGGPDAPLPQPATASELATLPALHQSHFLSQWSSLWRECQKWYNDRPVHTQPIVDVRGGEADQLDPNHDSALPILIYTTPMALVANTVYHITTFLLLGHKPRLIKSVPGPRCFASHIWHAQSIAGIAASNESPEQWDPVLVASLLLIARDMTHQSQQEVLVGIFSKIMATTGIKLNRETEALRSLWKTARLDEDWDEMDATC